MRCMFLITNKATFYLQLGLFTPLSNVERKLCIMTIKYNICEKRHEKKMTQKQLAMRAGISTAMVSFIENDKRQPNFLVIASIAKALNVKLDELVEIKDNYHYFRQ